MEFELDRLQSHGRRTRGRAALGVLGVVAALLLGGCENRQAEAPAAAELEGAVRGTVTYRERLALPRGATVEIRLEDVSRADAPAVVLGEQTITVEDRQVPLAFELPYALDGVQARGRYGIRAAIRAPDGTLLFATTEHHPAFDAAGRPAEATEIVVQRVAANAPATAGAPEVGRTFVFDCDGDISFTIRTGPGEVALWAPAAFGSTYQVLSLAVSASGARYVEGDTVFWNKGELATFEIAGRRFIDCRSNPGKVPWADAARRGVVFRALGNEPSWYVEVLDNRFVIVTELGTNRVEFPYAEPAVTGARTTYRSSGSPVTVQIERRACNDTMSGEAFEASATVTLEDRVLNGCGRFL